MKKRIYCAYCAAALLAAAVPSVVSRADVLYDFTSGQVIVTEDEDYSSAGYMAENTGIVTMPEEVTAESGLQGYLTEEGQIDTYVFEAEESGLYQFHFENSDDTAWYQFVLTRPDKSTKTVLVSDAERTERIDLEQGAYNIQIRQYSKFPEYKIDISAPEPTAEITGNSFSGELTYLGETDRFTLRPAVSGKYRFYLNNKIRDGIYNVRILDEYGNKIASKKYDQTLYTYDPGRESFADLEAGTVYTVEVVCVVHESMYEIDIMMV